MWEDLKKDKEQLTMKITLSRIQEDGDKDYQMEKVMLSTIMDNRLNQNGKMELMQNCLKSDFSERSLIHHLIFKKNISLS